MLVGIHQLHYLPWLRYVEKIARCDAFIVLDNIQYNKNGWQNRNRIKSSQGPQTLTVPIFSKDRQRLDEVRIDSSRNWGKKHWRSIEQAYAKAPFFETYRSFLEETYARDWETLNDLNRHMLDEYIRLLGIETSIHYASELDVPGEATERLVNLIRAVGGDAYYSGAFALEAYLDEQVLEAAGIGLVLQQWESPEYPQLHGAYEPDLSIVDLMMNCGPASLQALTGTQV
jgi:WbqC-like protein family